MEWCGEAHEAHATDLVPLVLPEGVALRAGAGGDGDGLVALRAFRAGETVLPWEVGERILEEVVRCWNNDWHYFRCFLRSGGDGHKPSSVTRLSVSLVHISRRPSF